MKSKSTFLLLALALFFGIGYFTAKSRIPSTEESVERSRKVFDFKSVDVTEIEIKGVNRNFLFERVDRKWNLKRPLAVRASSSEVDGILSTLEYLERRRVISPKQIGEAKLTLADYGLDKSRLIATFKTKSGAVVVHIGNEAKQGDDLYIQVEGDPNVLVVERELASKLDKKLEDYRERALFDFPISEVNQFQIKNGMKLWEFMQTNQLWRVVQPLNARADSSKVEEFLRMASSLRAQDFLSDDPAASKEYNLEDAAQEVTFVLSRKNAAPETLLLGQRLKADDKKMAAKIKGENAIVSIDAGFGAEAGKSLNDFRDRNVAAFIPGDVTQIQLKNRQVSVLLERNGSGWKILQQEKMDADGELVEQFLTRLNSMQIREFVADVVTDMEKFGLKSPLTTITLLGKGSGGGDSTNLVPFVQLSIGKEDAAKKLTCIKIGDESSVYGVDSSEILELPKSSTDLRARVLFEIKKEALKVCTQKKGKGSVVLERSSDGGWKISEDSQGVLDETAWQRFLNALPRFAVEKMIGTALNPSLKQYGLDAPIATWTVQAEIDGKASSQEVLVGRETPQKKYYILWKNELLICEVSRDLWQVISKDWVIRSASK